MASGTAAGQYASVNGLEMYYEVHGDGKPFLLIHGAYMQGAAFGGIVHALAADRQVITVDLQGHGRTADIDRPLRFETMADDVAALLREIGIERADVYGYSMGGAVAMQLAIRHPECVDKLIAVSVAYSSDGFQPGVLDGIQMITPEALAGTPMETWYMKVAPNPENWPVLIEKVKELDGQVFAWPAEDIQGIKAPTMLVFADADMIRPEHAVELFRLLGGGNSGPMGSLPKTRLAVLPGTNHISLFERTDLLVPMIAEFLAAPVTDASPAA